MLDLFHFGSKLGKIFFGGSWCQLLLWSWGDFWNACFEMLGVFFVCLMHSSTWQTDPLRSKTIQAKAYKILFRKYTCLFSGWESPFYGKLSKENICFVFEWCLRQKARKGSAPKFSIVTKKQPWKDSKDASTWDLKHSLPNNKQTPSMKDTVFKCS